MSDVTTETPEAAVEKPRRFPWLPGVIGVLLAVAAGVLQILGIVQASNLNWQRGTLFAWLAVGASVAGFAVGLAAVILSRGRRWGIVALVGSLVANPFLLAHLLGALA